MLKTRKTEDVDRTPALAEADRRLEYELARLPREMTSAVTWFMKEHKVTKRELADRLGVTPGRVSQILSGDENLTLRTFAAVCAVLDAHLEIDLVPNGRPAPRGGANATTDRQVRAAVR